MNEKIQVGLADDHVLLRAGLAALVTSLGYSILFQCSNGKELLEKIQGNNLPDVILMDINMPEMDGFETTHWLKKNHPSVKILALSMYDDENSIIRMIKNGAQGYVLKEIEPAELKVAIDNVLTKGFHYSETVTGRLIHSMHHLDDVDNKAKQILDLSEREIEFLKLASTEMTYKEIAAKMRLSPRTIDGYREALFEKLNVKSRIGLVLFAIKKGFVQLNQSF